MKVTIVCKNRLFAPYFLEEGWEVSVLPLGPDGEILGKSVYLGIMDDDVPVPSPANGIDSVKVFGSVTEVIEEKPDLVWFTEPGLGQLGSEFRDKDINVFNGNPTADSLAFIQDFKTNQGAKGIDLRGFIRGESLGVKLLSSDMSGGQEWFLDNCKVSVEEVLGVKFPLYPSYPQPGFSNLLVKRTPETKGPLQRFLFVMSGGKAVVSFSLEESRDKYGNSVTTLAQTDRGLAGLDFLTYVGYSGIVVMETLDGWVQNYTSLITESTWGALKGAVEGSFLKLLYSCSKQATFSVETVLPSKCYWEPNCPDLGMHKEILISSEDSVRMDQLMKLAKSVFPAALKEEIHNGN